MATRTTRGAGQRHSGVQRRDGVQNNRARSHSRRRVQSEYFFDYSLLFIVLFLLGFGMIMIYSASSYEAFQMFNGDAAYYLKKQVLAVAIGLVAMMVMANIPYHFWERFAVIGYVVSMFLILLVLTPLGIESHGARRWFRIPGVGMQIQPAEVAKLAMILFLAVMVCKMGKSVGSFKGLVIMMLMPMPIVLMIWKITDNLSSAIIVLSISFLMVFVASPDYKKFIALGAAGAAMVTLFVMYVSRLDPSTNFRFRRIQVWLNPESDAQDKGFQTLQGLYAIGSGGVLGKGLGKSMQKLSFLPEAQNDMIFSIICEELGLFGAIAIILMFILLIWRMMIIANNASDLFGAMLVVGVIGHIAVQAILNIAVVTNSMPNTGISLPFISYGGTSVVFLLSEIGLVLSVAKRIQLKEL
jgi:cell division protein FtsW